ncbi:Vancomycin resistance protein YoaR, contains peptidoglycan-binding and VanW domains [Peptoclostridium litorale DSM 5388]|uniref:Putative peptidoglycan binding protein n=1 Tax=Peptoclostridium litorale DSM 5388 TaxID=1121324 RepID=A0A069RHA4_PEPLI|nr:VanW family protein [Peptoclostridium litorale]KDR95550.1 putative peptidoglycan binding protein [Peptoclostridium litorale DSM 5388]SIN98085.1 Vancomycin resistance protein YoaR, contains peptidoglycan-binding and VanW domains [Peptoclostridium litorale DSM 5388]
MTKKKIALISVLIVFLAAAGGLIFSYNVFSSSDIIAKGIYVRDSYIGELTKEEAKNMLAQKYSVKTIDMAYDGNTFEINPEDIGFESDIENTVEDAFGVGREGIADFIGTMALGEEKVLDMEPVYDESKLDSIIEDIAASIDKAPNDARVSMAGGGINIKPDTQGVRVERDVLRESIGDILEYKSVEANIEIPVETVNAKIRYEDVKGIRTLLGSYSTKYSASNLSRSENLKVASNSISGKILMPGQVFSMNETTGKRSVQNGYKMAKVIVKGKLEEGLGGGVCQVSSTLYNAVIRSGLEVVARRNHSIPSSYVGLGLDATVSYGSIDFKFKNNFKNPIYLQIKPQGGHISAQIYGYDEDKHNVSIETQIVGEIPRTVENKEDANLEEGKQIVEEQGRDGYKVKSYRVFMDSNGNVVDKQTLSNDYYPPMKKVVVSGTKKIQPEQSIQPEMIQSPQDM